MPELKYIVLTDGTTIPFNFISTSFSSYNSTSGRNASFNEPLMTNGYLPVYEKLRNAFLSAFDYADKSPNGEGWVQTGANQYEWGIVLATTEPKEYGGLQYVGAIVASIISYSPLTLAQRQANYNNGFFIEENSQNPWYFGTPYVCIKYARYDSTFDYSKFIFGMRDSDSSTYGRPAWTQYDAYGVSSTYKPQLFEANYSWQRLANIATIQDGEGFGGTLSNTMLLPMYFEYDTQYRCSFLATGIVAASGALLPYTTLSGCELGVNYGLYRTNAVEFEYSAATNRGFDFLEDFHSGLQPYVPPDHPFEEDTNEGGGGTGEYTDTSDEVPIDGTPSTSALTSGFIDAYLLTQQNAIDFHTYMMSGSFTQNVSKLMNDPIDYIIGFMLAPYTPETGSAHNIYIGGTDSEVSAIRITSGYKSINCGSVDLKEFWGKFYDYGPYTKVQVYLPFIGVRPLDIDDTMAGTLSLNYRIDVLTGDCVATISVSNARGTKGAIYNFNGNCHAHIPICGKNSLATGLSVAGGVVGMASSVAMGNAAGAIGGAINTLKSAKTDVEHAGNLSGQAGLLANFTPFLVVSRPSQSLAANYNHYHGFISNITAQLSALSGYTQVAELVQINIH